MEALVQKKVGRTSGWVGYTLSWSNRRFDDLNGGSGSLHLRPQARRERGGDARIQREVVRIVGRVYGTGRAVTLTESLFGGLAFGDYPAVPSGKSPATAMPTA